MTSTGNVQLLKLRKDLLTNNAAELRAAVCLHAHSADDQLPQFQRVSRGKALQQASEHIVAVVVYLSSRRAVLTRKVQNGEIRELVLRQKGAELGKLLAGESRLCL